jgi:DNA gyrase subunit A
MPLKRLASLERKKIEQEYKDLMELVKELQALLKSEAKRLQAIITELAEIKTRFGDSRKTQIVMLKQGKVASDLLTVKEVTPVENVWVAISKEGKVAKMSDNNPPRMGGREAPALLLKTDSHQNLYMVSKSGKCACVAVQSLALVEDFDSAIDIHRVSSLREGETPEAIFCLSHEQKHSETLCITTLTKQGMIKKSLAAELPGPSSDLFVLCKVNEGDELGWAMISESETQYFILTSQGMSIRFEGNEVRVMGLVAAGVNALKLGSNDKVAGLAEITKGLDIFAVSTDGKGWRMEEGEFPLQGRYGQGVNTCKLKPGSEVVGITVGKKNTQIALHLKKAAAKIIRLDEIPTGKRATSGKTVVELKPGDEVQVIVSILDNVALPVGSDKLVQKSLL